MGSNSEARKRIEACGVAHSLWSAQVFRDGMAVTDPVPCNAWDAAGIAAPVISGWLGGPVSIAHAVVAHNRDRAYEPELFSALDDEVVRP